MAAPAWARGGPGGSRTALGAARHHRPPDRGALGLRWSDVDLIAGRLQVRRALQRQRGRGLVFVEPKSVTSRRCVELPQVAIAVLKQQRAPADGELVFPNRDGEPMEPGTVSDALKVALDRVGPPRIRVHDLRHTTATVLLEAGVHPKLVQHLGRRCCVRATSRFRHRQPRPCLAARGSHGAVARVGLTRSKTGRSADTAPLTTNQDVRSARLGLRR